MTNVQGPHNIAIGAENKATLTDFVYLSQKNIAAAQ